MADKRKHGNNDNTSGMSKSEKNTKRINDANQNRRLKVWGSKKKTRDDGSTR